MKEHEAHLPWLINGSLSGQERDTLETELANNAALQKEQQFLASLRSSIQKQKIQSPGELGLARLKRDMASHKKSQAASTSARNWKPFAIAASVLLVMQSALLVHLQQKESPPVYTTLSGETIAGPHIQITFHPGTTEAQIRAALSAIEGRIIDGPGSLGVYRVLLPGSLPADIALTRLGEYAFIESATEN